MLRRLAPQRPSASSPSRLRFSVPSWLLRCPPWLRAFVAPWLLASCCRAQSVPQNLDFEQGQLGQPPPGWVCPTPGYRIELTDREPKRGRFCVRLANETKNPPAPFGNILKGIDATPYRGKTVRFKAAVRCWQADTGDRAQLWFRVDRPNQQLGFFDNMGDRPINAREWEYYEIVGDVADDAAGIVFGCMLVREGQAWLDDVTLEVVADAEKPLIEPPRPLEGRALENLVAFAKLFGYVRYFHPSDEAAATDWDAFAIRGVRAVESASGEDELSTRLRDLLEPIAPLVQIAASHVRLKFNLVAMSTFGLEDIEVVRWRHLGVGTGGAPSIYSSRREYEKLDRTVWEEILPENDKFVRFRAGVQAAIPNRLAVRDRKTLELPEAIREPRASTGTRHGTATAPASPRRTANDRATRLADVVIAWNIFQHFYPYFDVVQTDWEKALRDALTKAATDRNELEFLDTLRLMVAALHDGHGHVSHPSEQLGLLPILWDWIEDRLVITAIGKPPTGDATGAEVLKPGDIVRTINGRPAAEALADAERFVSGATPQWIRRGGLMRIASGRYNEKATLEIQPRDGATKFVEVAYGPRPLDLAEPRPEKIAEIRPGIWYVDIDRINDPDFIAAVPKLEKADGIVFDLRGYPRNLSAVVISHLIDAPVQSPRWNVPIITKPDRQDVEWQVSGWSVMPIAPRFSAKVAFLTGGGAISYAETYLGIIENYKLAEIVGGPTAGTNGNVNPFQLPGGYHVAWTGMKVLKHDGSPHHGVGIRPTVPVSRTIAGVRAGADEVLERAIDVVSPSPR